MSKEQSKYLIKRSGAIHVENSITLVQRKIWNVLLAEAFVSLVTEQTHFITVEDLLEKLDYKNKNYQYIYDNLNGLIRANFHGNLLNKDGGSWVASTFLAGVEIKNGIIEYQFSDVLKKLLHKPEMYAKISLLTQNKFKSKYALALYELCIDYFDVRRQFGETSWIPLNTFRLLMGVQKDQYSDYRDLKKRTIKRAVEEINDEKNCPIEVDYEERPKRSVRDIKFKIKPKIKQSSLSIVSESNVSADLRDKIVKLGLTREKAEYFLAAFDNELINDWIIVLNGGYISSQIKNKAGYFISMIEQGAIPPSNYLKEKQKINVNNEEKVKQQDELANNINSFNKDNDIEERVDVIINKLKNEPDEEKDRVIKEVINLYKIKEPLAFRNLCELFGTNLEEWKFEDYISKGPSIVKYSIDIYLVMYFTDS